MCICVCTCAGFPSGSDGNESACDGFDPWVGFYLGSIPRGWEDPLEEGVATHSSVVASRISWTEKTDGLQSIGSQSQT